MFEAFKNFVADLASGERHPSGFGPDDYRLAAAALLVHAAVIDGKFTEAPSSDTLRALLQERFALDDAKADDADRSRRPRPSRSRSISIISRGSSTARSTKRAASASSR